MKPPPLVFNTLPPPSPMCSIPASDRVEPARPEKSTPPTIAHPPGCVHADVYREKSVSLADGVASSGFESSVRERTRTAIAAEGIFSDSIPEMTEGAAPICTVDVDVSGEDSRVSCLNTIPSD
ncbi:hypothetical protein BU17DRAFT_88137 [Hysterangium stoloniferum]|nr:hypothetical protein BU17DRAFT_88137 [Hysterangium stoloniferum]